MLATTLFTWPIFFAVLIFAVAPLAVQSSYQYPAEIGNFLRTQPKELPVIQYCSHPSEAVVYYAQREIFWGATGIKMPSSTNCN